MKLFTKMFGVGVKTASQWYQEGLRTLQDLQMRCTKLSREQQAGLLHYTDLSTPVERPEAEAISQLVREVAERYLPGTSVTLTGGFRRGKRSGHDVDLLITHPVESREEGLLSKIISWLHSQGFLLYQNSCRNTFQPFKMEVQEASGSAGSMDRFEQCFSIFRLADRPGGPRGDAGAQKPGASSSRKAVRVDLVISPYSQFPFALLGWTGSRNFERDLRRFARQEKKMALNSHALYHMEQYEVEQKEKGKDPNWFLKWKLKGFRASCHLITMEIEELCRIAHTMFIFITTLRENPKCFTSIVSGNPTVDQGFKPQSHETLRTISCQPFSPIQAYLARLL
ncbi:DNA-directed DNA/RNA polymerase mu [Varanus komodoensis]|nr:DNA-directed DNA/RNA polymerase mu [Varanus komodoensis]